jgi:hypothetical protein
LLFRLLKARDCDLLIVFHWTHPCWPWAYIEANSVPIHVVVGWSHRALTISRAPTNKVR